MSRQKKKICFSPVDSGDCTPTAWSHRTSPRLPSPLLCLHSLVYHVIVYIHQCIMSLSTFTSVLCDAIHLSAFVGAFPSQNEDWKHATSDFLLFVSCISARCASKVTPIGHIYPALPTPPPSKKMFSIALHDLCSNAELTRFNHPLKVVIKFQKSKSLVCCTQCSQQFYNFVFLDILNLNMNGEEACCNNSFEISAHSREHVLCPCAFSNVI